MAITYSTNADGSTNAMITPNEGVIASIVTGISQTFTFNFPAGNWVTAVMFVGAQSVTDPVLVYTQSFGSLQGSYYINATSTGQVASSASQKFQLPPSGDVSGNIFSFAYFDGNQNSPSFGPVLVYAEQGGTATAIVSLPAGNTNGPCVNHADTAIHTVSASLTLTSAPPPPPPPPPSPPPPPPPPPKAIATPLGSYALAEDAHGRPLVLSPNFAVRVGIGISGAILESGGYYATSINGLVSNTAGKTYLLTPISDVSTGDEADNFGADNPSLLVDRRTNHFRAIYSLSDTYIYGGAGQTRPADEIALASGLISDRFAAQIALIPSVSGGLCVAAQHPTDADYAVLVYSDIGTAAAPGSHDLKAAFSMDAGATWSALSTVLPAIDLTATGRPALCWLGNTAILVCSAGNALRSLSSVDRGKSWTAAPGALSTYTPNDGTNNVTYGYYCLSAVSHGGQVYLLAFAGDTQANPQPPPQTSPRLFVSVDAGQTWTLRAAEAPGAKSAPAEYGVKPPGTLPAIRAPSGLGVSPGSGLLRLDTSAVSHDCGLSWSAP